MVYLILPQGHDLRTELNIFHEIFDTRLSNAPYSLRQFRLRALLYSAFEHPRVLLWRPALIACLIKIRTSGMKSKGGVMNWDQIQGKWKQSAGVVKEKWGKLTDDDLTIIGGKKDQLVGKIQERYGIAREAAEKQVDEFTRAYNNPDVSRSRDERDADSDA